MASFNNVISYSERLKVVVRKNLRTIDEKYLTRDAVKVTELVNESINKLPLLFRIPIKWLLVFFGIFDFFCRLLSFNRLSSAKDYNFCYGILRITRLIGTMRNRISIFILR